MTKRLPLLCALLVLPLGCGGSTARRTPGNTDTGGMGDEETGGKGAGDSTGGKSGGTGGKAATGGSTGGGTGGATGEGGSSGGAGGSTGGAGGGGGDATGGAGTGGMGEAGSGPPPTGHLFGAHSGTYPAGSIRPAGGQAALDAAVKAAYDKWKAAYVTSACGGTVVKSTGETGQVTSSPALGLGMILTVMMAGADPDAQKQFDGMFAVARKYPSYLTGHNGLLCYAVIGGAGGACAQAKECDSTVDGDLDFAFALTLAAAQWGNGGAVKYADEAAKTLANVKAYDFTKTKLPLLGDWASLPGEPPMWMTCSKAAYFWLGHLRAFSKQTNDAFWMQSIDAMQESIAGIVSKNMTGLLPVILLNGTPAMPTQKVISDTDAGSYAGDAGGMPFRLAADVIASKDMRTTMVLSKMNAWIKMATGGDPSKIVNGYRLDGTAFGPKGTMAFIAPFGAAAVFDSANQAWLDAIWKLAVAAPATDQATDGMNILSMLVMSGNWWNP